MDTNTETRRGVAATHDFSAKLRQPSLLPRVREYIRWRREVLEAGAAGTPAPPYPDWAPLSINLDLTTACNYRCDHCIDWDILNRPVKYDTERLFASIEHMASRGLKSVILIGGGEPTLHPAFPEVVRRLKALGLQVAIVSNGSRNDRILEILDLLDERDWIRLSLDSGTDETFKIMHKPVRDLGLEEICSWIPRWRDRNPRPTYGFSFVIVWEGAQREEGIPVTENIDEIVPATLLAREHRFSYISLKPFLTRRAGGSEVMAPEEAADEARTLKRIRDRVDEAKALATGEFKVLESINLLVLEQGTWKEYTRQPKVCHMQALRQVLSPMGLYNCPAHRGVVKARIADAEAYADSPRCRTTGANTGLLLDRFDASKECAEVTCLYHRVNWWIEKAIREGRDPGEIAALEERRDWFL